MQLIKTVYAKSRRHGRRVSQVDQRYRKRAEELLNSELSVALGIPLKEVPAYINQKIGKPEKKAASVHSANGKDVHRDSGCANTIPNYSNNFAAQTAKNS